MHISLYDFTIHLGASAVKPTGLLLFMPFSGILQTVFMLCCHARVLKIWHASCSTGMCTHVISTKPAPHGRYRILRILEVYYFGFDGFMYALTYLILIDSLALRIFCLTAFWKSSRVERGIGRAWERMRDRQWEIEWERGQRREQRKRVIL